jgi:hypothetical protein
MFAVCCYRVVRLLKTRDTASRAVFTSKIVPPRVFASWLPLVEEFNFSSDGKYQINENPLNENPLTFSSQDWNPY